MKIEELKKLNDRLTSLLNDPQPGLFTWQGFVNEVMDQMTKEWNKGDPKTISNVFLSFKDGNGSNQNISIESILETSDIYDCGVELFSDKLFNEDGEPLT